MLRIVLMAGLVLSVAGCSRLGIGGGNGVLGIGGGNGFLGIGRNETLFEGQRYRSKAVADGRRDKQDFTATASPVSASLEGARQAAEYRATQHCIKFFGTSDIDWQIGPDTDAAALPIEGDTLVLRGSCVDR